MRRRYIAYLSLASILSVFVLAGLWEFWMEPLLLGMEDQERNAEKLEFVITATAFAALAVIVPAAISVRLIGAQERAHEGLLAAMGQAELANEAKSRFLANMSHELRTPLNAIIGFSDIIGSQLFGPVENEKYREYVRDINDSAYLLLDLVNDVLDLSKAEAGKLELQEAEFDLREIILSCQRLMRQRADLGEIRLESEIIAPVTRLRGDARKVQQILLNLLSNAVKFTAPGGRVWVEVRHDPARGLIVAVHDDGTGIPGHELAKIFEPFAQVDNSLTRSYHGTGLGLPLARAMAELHGGSLVLHSIEGVGTRATVTFPQDRVIHRTYRAA
jgi:signal transduction histidine kinase